MLDRNVRILINQLIYPVQFERDPVDGVDRIAQGIRAGTFGTATLPEYLAAVETALASTDEFGGLIPQPHSDVAIRRYLRELQNRLRDESRT